MSKPVFLDPSGRRGRITGWSLVLLLLLAATAMAAFAFTIVEVPVPGPLPLAGETSRLHALAARIDAVRRRLGRGAAALSPWLPTAPATARSRQTVTGFYVPWDDTSRASLAAHVGALDQVVPALAYVTGREHRLRIVTDSRFDAILAGARHRPRVLPMVQNALDGRWDGPGLAALLADPRARARLLDGLTGMVRARHGSGIAFDFEELPVSAQANYHRLLAEAHQRFAPRRWTVAVAVPVANPDWRLRDYARVADQLFVMLYDEHWASGDPGPIASQAWYVHQLQQAVREIGPGKVVATVANYGYDWSPGSAGTALTVEEAWLASSASDARIRFDPASGNSTFRYEEDGRPHEVWLLDAASAWNQLRAAHLAGVAGVAVWRLGSEDPGLWPDLHAFASGRVPDLGRIPTMTDVDVEGSGEILRIADVPRPGLRRVGSNSAGLIHSEAYETLPTPYVVRRTGYRPGLVALTFDDGPDAAWTPAVLDVLRSRHVPATFFVIGANGLAQPGLLERMVAEGHEIGNHSYTHPNFADLSARATRLELNATERLIEAYTGRSTRLFRAPYFGDAEPTTADELGPALAAQQDGYVNVGLHVDPGDWTRPGADAIVARAVAAVLAGNRTRSGQIVLLHDGGGDRAQTLAALPRIIDALHARGFRFVTASELAGLSRAQVMPRVTGTDLLAVRADVAMFLVLAGLSALLSACFAVAIVLGLLRAAALAGLALWSRPDTPPDGVAGQLISVLIPAFNEARVIEASVRRVLESRGVELEVVVIDDGSSDPTAAVVERAFASEPRVRLLTLPNGGKANALNRGLKLASGEIVVALDADTQFEPETIARLARWFADPAIGAVAGNAKVGNRVNLVTRWQAVEYVTSQNLERRALARLGAIMVVPGAVGAWRRSALRQAGGFPVETLAEDQDLTIAIQRAGWRIANDCDAVAWTESPQTLRGLARQRFRWAFGTLQCLWKHRSALREGGGLARIGMPQAWLFQILFSLLSPMIDLALLAAIAGTWRQVEEHGWDQSQSDVVTVALFWLLFIAADLICGWVGYRLDRRERRFPALLLVAQRFVYRQLMYAVVIRAVAAALRGRWVGWGKLERTGRMADPVAAPA